MYHIALYSLLICASNIFLVHSKCNKLSITKALVFIQNLCMKMSLIQCNYKTTWKSKLKQHIESVHKNVTYLCDQCDYKGIQKSNLKQHIQSVHGNITYPCDQ